VSSRVLWLFAGDRVHDAKNPLVCQVVVNRELHGSTSERSCRHIEIAVPDNITYEPGDHVGVYANNDPDLVLALAKCAPPLLRSSFFFLLRSLFFFIFFFFSLS
jgi:sulfite reductase alpha subunit-like flavoprotein